MIHNLIADVILLNNVLLLAFFIGFAIIFYLAHKDQNNTLVWTDLLLDTTTNRLSLVKLGNFFGIAISSWIMIYFVQVKEAYSIYPTLFIAWLAFLGGVYTLNSFFQRKNNSSDPATDK